MKIVSKILIFAVVPTLFADVGIYLWQRDQASDFVPQSAQILAISYRDETGRARYAKTLRVSLETRIAGSSQTIEIIDRSAQERPKYAEEHKVGDQVMYWRSVSGKNHASLFPPDSPQLFSWLYVLAPTVGLISLVIGALIFGERVMPKVGR